MAGASPLRIGWDLFGGLAAAALATAAGAVAWAGASSTDVALLYLVAIAAVGYALGRLAAAGAAFASILAFNFFFVEPFHTLYVTDTRHLITFAVMLGGGLAISELGDRTRREAAGAQNARELAHTEQVRAALLSSVSHDLRTPLSTIAGCASILASQDAALTPAQRVELAQSVESEAARLERLVTNLLDMTRLAAGPKIVRRGWFPPEELVGSALRRAEAALVGHPVSLDLPADLPLVSVDAVLLENALVNLLENAGVHTPAGTPVDVQVRRVNGTVTFEVGDRGPGLPPGDPARWFEPFARGGQRGSGLGLAICRGVAEVHGGSVAAANRLEGGASFAISLPLGEPAPPAEAPA
jgi:two-component system sensor histidine kinase KdpD